MGKAARVRANRSTVAAAPVVFVPGFGHADRAWTLIGRHLDRAGFSDVGCLDLAATRGDVVSRAERLAGHVAMVREITGSASVHLVGHNVGGIVARYYVQVLGGDESVATVVTVGTAHSGTDLTPVGLGPAAAQVRRGSRILQRLDDSARPTRVRWLNYFSEHDVFVHPASAGMLKHPLLRATNVLVSEHGHLSLMIPTLTCRSIAHQIAAAESVPGYGYPVATLPGGIVKLEDTGNGTPSQADLAAARALHPSNWGTRHSKLMQLAEQPSG